MATDFETIKQSAIKYANQARETMPIERAILFGSHAKGSATNLSDVDICFFVKSYGRKGQRKMLKQLISLTGDYKGIYFEPILFEISDLYTDNPFIKEILKSAHDLL
ncbi:MAG: nucleotidyltransferase domain-containing protein [Holophagaceae bacterium]|nr:nucleotidyltransferase domain-containing protein [Holophagaceae bacterium]